MSMAAHAGSFDVSDLPVAPNPQACAEDGRAKDQAHERPGPRHRIALAVTLLALAGCVGCGQRGPSAGFFCERCATNLHDDVSPF
jgi:hypothetical protein